MTRVNRCRGRAGIQFEQQGFALVNSNWHENKIANEMQRDFVRRSRRRRTELVLIFSCDVGAGDCPGEACRFKYKAESRDEDQKDQKERLACAFTLLFVDKQSATRNNSYWM